MYLYKILSILSFVGTVISDDSPCMCTTVPCPQNGENNIIMGQGGANMTYIYETFNEYVYHMIMNFLFGWRNSVTKLQEHLEFNLEQLEKRGIQDE